MLAKAPWRLRGRLGKETSAVFEAKNLQDARKRLEALEQGLGRHLPEAMECLREGFAAATCFFAFPEATGSVFAAPTAWSASTER